jgi:thymidylate kinase
MQTLDPPDPALVRIHSALAALDDARVPYRFRKGRPAEIGNSAGQELDIAIERSDARSADAALEAAGFRRLAAPGHGRHRFYLATVEGHWLKIDAKAVRGFQELGRGSSHRDRPVDVWRRVRRRLPASYRRVGPVIAILGPDGAGKGTVIERLEEEIPVAVSIIYLGTRPRRKRESSARTGHHPPGALRECAFLVRGYLRSLRILLAGYTAAWRGTIVLCDRHPLEAKAVQPNRTRLGGALERLMVRRLVPRPDAIVVLDAPAELLFERKGEHSVERLERWRDSYLSEFGGRGATVVPTSIPVEATVARVSEAVWGALSTRQGWR